MKVEGCERFPHLLVPERSTTNGQVHTGEAEHTHVELALKQRQSFIGEAYLSLFCERHSGHVRKMSNTKSDRKYSTVSKSGTNLQGLHKNAAMSKQFGNSCHVLFLYAHI